MRQGELLGLRRRDIDLDAGWLHIHAAVRRLCGEFLFTLPNTKRSRRGVAITSTAVALKRHRERWEEAKAAAGAAWQDNELVFPDTTGGHLEDATCFGTTFARSSGGLICRASGSTICGTQPLHYF